MNVLADVKFRKKKSISEINEVYYLENPKITRFRCTILFRVSTVPHKVVHV
jgi:hypothetical protein